MASKRWKECDVCQALNYVEDEICCVCHTTLEGSARKLKPLHSEGPVE